MLWVIAKLMVWSCYISYHLGKVKKDFKGKKKLDNLNQIFKWEEFKCLNNHNNF